MSRFNFSSVAIYTAVLSVVVLASAGMSFQYAHAAGLGSSTDTKNVGAADNTNAGTLANPLKFKTLDDLINAVLAAVVQLGGTILLFMLVWTGFKFVVARGNEEKIRDARRALLWTIIGGLILLGATAIKLVVQATVTSITP